MTAINLKTSQAPLICILGATATGKTRLGVALARRFEGEIISADSRQVYRGLDIGSGKDLDEYADTPYHLIDIVDPGHEFNLFEFVEQFTHTYYDISKKSRLPFLVGGTGMYLDAILNRYQLTRNRPGVLEEHGIDLNQADDAQLCARLKALHPDLHNNTDLEDRSRLIKALEIALSEAAGEPRIQAPEMPILTIGIHLPREQIWQRISQRLRARMEQGMIEEVEHLHAKGLSWPQLEFYGLEYRYIAQFLQGQLNRNDMLQKLDSAIRQFAKQQEKWFRNIAKKGHTINWIDADEHLESEACSRVEAFLLANTVCE